MKMRSRKICLYLTVLLILLSSNFFVAAKSGGIELDTSTSQLVKNREILAINLADLAELVFQENVKIHSQELEWEISKENVIRAISIFEPGLTCGFQISEVDQKNSLEESLSRQFSDVWKERVKLYDCALQSLILTGARYSFDYNINKVASSLTGDQDEYNSSWGISVVQPLLKNAGSQNTTAEIRTLTAESEIERQMYRQQMIQTFFEAGVTYWELYQSQERLNIRKDSVRIAEQISDDTQERVRIGKMAQTELLEADAGVLVRKSLEIQAEKELVLAMNNLRTYFSSSVALDDNYIIINDKIKTEDTKISFDESLKKAFENRPEYIASQIKIEQEDIRVSFAKNQVWPQLDLKASYKLNGLGVDYEDSINDQGNPRHENWTLGIEIIVPLGNKKSRSELAAVKYRKRQAILQAKAVEVTIANNVDTAIQFVYSTIEQVDHLNKAYQLNEKLLQVEYERLKAGKSNIRLVLEKQENFIIAREAELERLVDYKKALLQLLAAEGVLLRKIGVEIEG